MTTKLYCKKLVVWVENEWQDLEKSLLDEDDRLAKIAAVRPHLIFREIYTALYWGLASTEYVKVLNCLDDSQARIMFLLKKDLTSTQADSFAKCKLAYSVKVSRELFRESDLSHEGDEVAYLINHKLCSGSDWLDVNFRNANLVRFLMKKSWPPMSYMLIPSVLKAADDLLKAQLPDSERAIIAHLRSHFGRYF